MAGAFDQKNKVESRKDCLVHTSAPLERDLAAAGTPRVKLFVATDRADTDFAVRLSDVWPDGRSMLVADGIHRLSLRESTERASTVNAGEVYELTVELTPTAHTFLKGHSLRLVITGANYPRFERNPNNGKRAFAAEDAQAATNSVWRGGERASVLTLPALLEKKAE